MRTDYSDMLKKIEEKSSRSLDDHYLIIDGTNTLIRSFSLIKSMNATGHHIGGVVGFLRSLGFLTRTIDPTRVVVVFDSRGGSTNRKNIDPEYKATRQHMRITNWGVYSDKTEELEALTYQAERVRDYLECLPVVTLSRDKLEADDIIAFLARKVAQAGKKATIVSTDQDFLQLVDDNIEVYSPIKKVTYDHTNVQEQIKVLPENYNIVKALTGDNSDNLRGVKGVGIKTLVKEFPELTSDPDYTLDKVYEASAQNVEGKKIFAKIIYDWDRVETNFKLMDLHNSVLDETEQEYIYEALKNSSSVLNTGIFLHLLEVDKIEGITKNTESWLETFRPLAVYGK